MKNFIVFSGFVTVAVSGAVILSGLLENPVERIGSQIALIALVGLLGYTIYQTVATNARESALEGQPAAAFTLPVLGTLLATGPQEHLGKVVVVDFWATYCEPCVDGMPGLQRIYERFDGDDFSLLSINIDPVVRGVDRDAMIQNFREERDLSFPVLMDFGEASNAYGVVSIPYVVVIDREGNIRHVHSRPVSESRLTGEIEVLLNEAPNS
jgi:thiol-disulfide isomerase/thioredoxin